MSTSASIPIVDFSSLSLNLGDDQLDETEMKLTASELINAFTTTGFVYLSNTHFPHDLLKKATVVADKLFDLPLSAKKKYAADVGSNGYVESGQEFVNPERPGDLKECFNVSLEMVDDTSRFPCAEVPDFMKIIVEFIRQCCLLARRMFTALAHGLDLQDKSFLEKCHNMLAKPGNPSVLRLLRYPPLLPAEEIKPNQVRLGEHCDYGTFTLLFQLDTEGLQVQRRDGEWVDAVPIPNTVVINIGDLLQRWTSDKLISTCHRVMIPDDEVKRQTMRRSIAFFVHPDDDVTVECLDGSDKYPPVNGTEYLHDKLKASYFY